MTGTPATGRADRLFEASACSSPAASASSARTWRTLVHYPVPVHEQPAYRSRLALDPAGLTHSEAAARTVLSLPMHGHLEQRAAERVALAIRRILAA